MKGINNKLLSAFRPLIACLVMLATATATAADLGTPRLTDGLAPQKYFDPDRYLTGGGVKYTSAKDVTLEPQVGFGYGSWEREAGSGFDEVIRKVHAQAGGRVDLSGKVYVSAAAKMPVYTYQLTERRLGGDLSYQAPVTRHDYDLFRRPGGNLTWTGEMGIRLGGGADLNVFYDLTPFTNYQGGNSFGQTEERFGTRIIFRFR